MNEKDIKNELVEYIRSKEGTYAGWFVGSAKDVEDQLFNYHKVSKENDKWVSYEVDSPEAAKNVVKYFLDKLKTQGSLSDDPEVKSLYAYRTNKFTRE